MSRIGQTYGRSVFCCSGCGEGVVKEYRDEDSPMQGKFIRLPGMPYAWSHVKGEPGCKPERFPGYSMPSGDTGPVPPDPPEYPEGHTVQFKCWKCKRLCRVVVGGTYFKRKFLANLMTRRVMQRLLFYAAPRDGSTELCQATYHRIDTAETIGTDHPGAPGDVVTAGGVLVEYMAAFVKQERWPLLQEMWLPMANEAWRMFTADFKRCVPIEGCKPVDPGSRLNYEGPWRQAISLDEHRWECHVDLLVNRGGWDPEYAKAVVAGLKAQNPDPRSHTKKVSDMAAEGYWQEYFTVRQSEQDDREA